MLAAAVASGSETVALEAAIGRVLAEPVTALRDQPPFDASAMDGWAVSGPGDGFRIMGESAAGHGYHAPLAAGQAVRVFTGAPVPPGADRVVIQEVAVREGAVVRTSETGGSKHIRPRGGDFREGAVLLQPGLRLDPWRLSLAASAGRAALVVARRPKVVVLSTGEEIVPAGAPIGPDQIYDSGSPTLAALVAAWGGEPRRLAIAGDDAAAIRDAVRDAGGDLVVTLGGASVGDHDLVKPALSELGLDLSVETLKLRPGKPTWFGVLDDGRRVLGLPGNPASALVCAELFLRPLLMKMQGAAPGPALLTARLAKPLPANGPREHWARARSEVRDGGLFVEAMTDQDSSLVSVFAQADVLIRCPINAPAAEAGDLVEVLRLDRL
ncbi:MAG: molybdopterin molybdotransferase MoeA [Phenylobacterium sp.]|nr:MAG: molybdopterin molybdotransferase MoeA [Phenylobacterium sp.]